MRTLIIAGATAATLSMATSLRAAGVTVDQSGQQFSEKTLSINHGDTITFANKDDVSHNITVVDDSDDAVDLGLQKPGESLSHAFGKDGKFKIRCSIHPSMKMTVTVK